MLWLQSNERYDLVAQFDPSSYVLTELDRCFLGNTVPGIFHGFFSHFGESRIGVYGLAGKLFLLIDDRLFELEASDTIEVDGPTSARHLRVLNNVGKVISETRYSLHEVAGPIPDDPTPFVDNEDFDIGLLASNVSKNPERRAIFTNK